MSAEQTAEIALLTAQLEELNRIGAALSAERDTTRLLDLILTKARAITGSDAGSLYVVVPAEPTDDDGENEAGERQGRLRFMIAQNDSVTLPFKETQLDIDDVSIAGHVALTAETVLLDDAYRLPEGAPYGFSRGFDAAAGYRTRSVLAAPLQTPKGRVVGVVQLINAKRDPAARLTPATLDEHVVPFSPRHVALVTSLAAQAAIALENSQLYAEIQQLFEGFVRASVVAIEARDPATFGHSFRVTNLTVALAETVDRAGGLFAGVRFSTEDLRTIRYAALLHDFGKVGVREQVLVKAKKLYPAQSALIAERFKLARRSRELDSMQARLDCLLKQGTTVYEARLPDFDAELAREIAALQRDLAAILAANEPTPVEHGHFERLREIAAVTFDDVDGRARPLLDAEEVRLLSLRKGSLSEAERIEIESHVVHTFNFLKQIPWTAEIRRIPAIARGHHEMLNGTGYPRRLAGADIPVQTRMLTICDIFDALAAADRPYKSAVPLDRALDILRDAVSDGQIDRDLFDLFVDARVFDRWHEEPHAY